MCNNVKYESCASVDQTMVLDIAGFDIVGTTSKAVRLSINHCGTISTNNRILRLINLGKFYILDVYNLQQKL